MRRQLAVSFLLVLVTLIGGCATLPTDYEKPQVNVTSFSLAPQSDGVTPKFLIGLQVINPNRVDLNPVGMSYSVEVENHRVLSGAKPDLPRIPAYGSADFTIEASPDLLGSARLLNELLSGQHDSLHYLFKARIDIGRLLPYINIDESGEFSLKPNGTNTH